MKAQDSVVENHPPLVSVIVPFFNSEQTLAACAESLLGQEGLGGPFEVLFIDNGSPDKSRWIVERYPEVTLLEELTPGAYVARNTGIRRARAPLIALTDADCVADKDWLRSIAEGMEDRSIGMQVGHCRYPDEASLPLRLLGAYENAKTQYVIEHCSPDNHFAYANNLAVRASVFEEIGLFKEWTRAADSELVHRMAAQCPDLKLAFQPAQRVNHLEFLRARDRARRLSLYTETNSKIESFRELRVGQRLGVLRRMLGSLPGMNARARRKPG